MAVVYKRFCTFSSLLKKPRRVDDGISPLGPRQSLCCRKGARREVSLRLCRMNCHRQFIPTTTASGCRGFESRHTNKEKAPHLNRYGAFSSRVDDGIPPPGPRQSLCCRKGARREVSLRLSRERQSSPTTTCGCRGFESRHANAQQKAPYLSRYGAYLLFKGGRWDSNPRQPEPQSGALPLNYVHHLG